MIFSWFGMMYSSSGAEKALCVSREATRITGPSRLSKRSEAIRAATSPPMPPVSRASWTTRTLPVFRTERSIVFQSIGSSVRRSITSMSISDAMSRAAFITAWTGEPYVTTVRSRPSLRRAAFPIGTT